LRVKEKVVTNINTYVFFSFYVSFFFSIPIILYFSFSFVKSGLFFYERQLFIYVFRIFIRFLLISFFLSYFFFIPFVLFFLSGFSIMNNVDFIILKTNANLYFYLLLHYISNSYSYLRLYIFKTTTIFIFF